MPDEADLGRPAGDLGPDRPPRLLISGPDGTDAREEVLADSFAVVGRDKASDLVLRHPEVSRRHALLLTVAGRLFAVDLGSRTGTRLAGEPVDSGWVGADGVEIGPYLVRPAEAPPDEGQAELPLPTSRAFQLPGAAPLTLEFPGPVPERGTWRASRVLVLLGRSPVCRVRFADPDVASLHAAIVRTPEGARVLDLLGRADGTLVNGRAVRSALLRHGDELRIGGHALRVWHDVSATTPALLRPAGPPGALAGSSPDVPARFTDPDLAALIDELGRRQDQASDGFQQTLMTMLRLFAGMHREQMDLLREELSQFREAADSPTSPAESPPSPALPPSPSPSPERPREAASPRPTPAAAGTQADAHLALVQRLVALQQERQGGWQKILGSMLGGRPD